MSALASSAMPRRLPPGCIEDRDRHGTVRIYYRTKGRPKVRLRGTPWTPEFMAEYEVAKGIDAAVSSRSRATVPGTWRWLCVRYFAECAEYKRLDSRTQHVRRMVLEGTFDEVIAPGSVKLFRDFPLSRMTTDAVEVLRDRKIHTPEAANSRLKAMRQVFKWGLKKKLAPSNPARDVEYFRIRLNGIPHVDSGGGTTVRGASPGREQGPSCVGPLAVHRATPLRYHPFRKAARQGRQAHVHAT